MQYCYFINWKWIVPFEVITQQEYIEISQKDDINYLGREIPHLDYIANVDDRKELEEYKDLEDRQYKRLNLTSYLQFTN